MHRGLIGGNTGLGGGATLGWGGGNTGLGGGGGGNSAVGVEAKVGGGGVSNSKNRPSHHKYKYKSPKQFELKGSKST